MHRITIKIKGVRKGGGRARTQEQREGQNVFKRLQGSSEKRKRGSTQGITEKMKHNPSMKDIPLRFGDAGGNHPNKSPASHRARRGKRRRDNAGGKKDTLIKKKND